MTWWITVAAVRIHGWIEQTPKLSHMRGASQALHRLTSYDIVKELDVEGVTIHKELTAVDGVVVATTSDEARAREFAGLLSDHLAHVIPGSQWESWWSEAPSYGAAYSLALDPFVRTGRLIRLPALQDNGLVMSCLLCRSEPAGAPGGRADDVLADDGPITRKSQGAGCRVRDAEGQKTSSRKDGSIELLDLIPGARRAEDFEELARKGGLTGEEHRALGRKESRSHLATIYADGNGMGALFQGLATTSLPLSAMHESAIGKLNDVTHSAVAQAAVSISMTADGEAAEPDVKAVEAHFVGGDDVLASVPAVYGWKFAANLAQAFDDLKGELEALLDEALKDQPSADPAEVARIRALIDKISLGVGLVFAHASFPFADSSALAELAMKAAKKAREGGRAAIGWADATAENGGGEEHWSFVIDVDRALVELASVGPTFPAVFLLTPSARSQLGFILRTTSPRTVEAAVQEWAKRLDDTKVALALAKQSTRSLIEDLSRARWWPAATREEA